MKKIACFGLIVLLFMNTMGYYAVFWGFQVHSDKKLTERLDDGSYDRSNTITIKVPVSIPYMMDQQDFSRTDGKFLNEGKYYRMVKQRYAKDTLTIICIEDTNTEQIQTALGDYVKNFADNSQQNTKHNSKLPFSVIKDFIGHSAGLITGTTEGWNQDIKRKTHFSFDYSAHIAAITHPPEYC